MEKIFLKKKYLEKIKYLNKCNKYYYIKSKPLISDNEYDKIKNETLIIEKYNPNFITGNSPSRSVGFKPSKTLKK